MILNSNTKSAMVVTGIHHLITKVDYCTPTSWNSLTKCSTRQFCRVCAHCCLPFEARLYRFLSFWCVIAIQKSIVLLHNEMKLLCCCSFFNIFLYLQSGPVCFNCLVLNASKCVSVDSIIRRHAIFYNKRISKNVFHRNSILLLCLKYVNLYNSNQSHCC